MPSKKTRRSLRPGVKMFGNLLEIFVFSVIFSRRGVENAGKMFCSEMIKSFYS